VSPPLLIIVLLLSFIVIFIYLLHDLLAGADDRYGRQPGHEGLMCEVRLFLFFTCSYTRADRVDFMDRSSTSTRSRSIKESESFPTYIAIKDKGERISV
jgi:hypothetical protein